MPRPSDEEEDDYKPRKRSRPARDDEDEDDFARPRPKRRKAQARDNSGSKTLFIVLGSLGAVFALCIGGVVAMYMFAVKPVVEKAIEKVKEAEERMSSTNNAKLIGMGTIFYHDINDRYPLVYANTINQPPADITQMLSWRVSVLPYLEQQGLHQQFNLNENWDSATNKPLGQRRLAIFADDLQNEQTRYRCFYDNDAIFSSNPRQTTRLSNIHDGTSNTMIMAEFTETVPWSQCNELRYDPARPLPAFGKPNTSAFIAAFADGSVRTIRKTVDEKMLRNAITKADGNVVILD